MNTNINKQSFSPFLPIPTSTIHTSTTANLPGRPKKYTDSGEERKERKRQQQQDYRHRKHQQHLSEIHELETQLAAQLQDLALLQKYCQESAIIAAN